MHANGTNSPWCWSDKKHTQRPCRKSTIKRRPSAHRNCLAIPRVLLVPPCWGWKTPRMLPWWGNQHWQGCNATRIMSRITRIILLIILVILLIILVILVIILVILVIILVAIGVLQDSQRYPTSCNGSLQESPRCTGFSMVSLSGYPGDKPQNCMWLSFYCKFLTVVKLVWPPPSPPLI